ncbi:MAG: DUF3617 family protein [Vicinamibacterales bacterium]
MKLMPVAVALLACTAISNDAAAQQNPMRPGRWEITAQMEMPGMPMQMPPMKNAQCVTQQQIDSPTRGLPQGPDSKDCKVSDYKVSGNTITWTMACPSQQMTGSGELKFDGDTYAGLVKIIAQGKEMNMKFNGKRVGDCTQ